MREIFDGETLEELTDRGLTLEKAADLARQMVRIGAELESKGVCHREINPRMLLVSKDGRLTLRASRFETTLEPKVEPRWAEQEWRILADLAEGYRPAGWCWNDRFALARCIETLPPFEGRVELIDELMKDIDRTSRRVVFRLGFWLKMALLGRFAVAKPTPIPDSRFDGLIDTLKSAAWTAGINVGRLCIVGSTPLNVYGVRRCGDVDFVLDGDYEKLGELDKRLSPAEKDLKYYTVEKKEIIDNPRCHFRYRGIKVITLEVLKGFKETRRNGVKDADDRRHVIALQAPDFYHRWASLPYCWQRFTKGIHFKEQIDGVKTVRIFGIERCRKKKSRH